MSLLRLCRRINFTDLEKATKPTNNYIKSKITKSSLTLQNVTIRRSKQISLMSTSLGGRQTLEVIHCILRLGTMVPPRHKNGRLRVSAIKW